MTSQMQRKNSVLIRMKTKTKTRLIRQRKPQPRSTYNNNSSLNYKRKATTKPSSSETMMKSISLSRSMMVADDVDYVFVEADDADDDLSFVEKEELEGYTQNGSSSRVLPPMSPGRGDYDTHKALLVLGANYAHNKGEAMDSMSAVSAMVSDDEDDVDASMTITDSVLDDCPSITKSDELESEDMDVDGQSPEDKLEGPSSNDPSTDDIKSELAKKYGLRRMSKKKQRAAARKMKKLLGEAEKKLSSNPESLQLIDSTQQRLSKINKKMKIPM